MKLTEQHFNTLRKLNSKSCMAKDLSHGAISQMALHVERWLNDLQQEGFAVLIQDLWHITNAGRERLAKRDSDSIKMIHLRNKTSVYDLDVYVPNKQQVYRTGSLDFLKCPSKIGNYLSYPQQGLATLA